MSCSGQTQQINHPIFIANRVSEILENISVDQWSHVATCVNPADAGTRGMSAEVLQFSSWVRGPDYLRTKHFPFEPNTDVVDITLGVVIKEQDDSISSLTASVTKPLKKQSISLIPFDKFSSYQKLLRVTAYMLRSLPSHESYRTVDCSIANPVELTKPSVIFSTWFKENPLIPDEGIFLTTIPLRVAAALLSLLRLLVLVTSSVLLANSDG